MGYKNWPVWKKVLGIISLVLVILDIIFLFVIWIDCYYIAYACDPLGPALLTIIFLLPALGIIIGSWIIGYLIAYLIKRMNTSSKKKS